MRFPARHPARTVIVGNVFLIAVGVAVFAALIACTPEQDQAPKAAATPESAVPDYEVVKTTEAGLTMDIVAEVIATPPGDGLRQIFDDIRGKYDNAGGYFVAINCSTGHRLEYEHRLAFGRYGVGKEGEAATGLKPGEVDFQTFDDRDCPAD